VAKDCVAFSNLGASSNLFTLLGGEYAIIVSSVSWNGGNVTLRVLAPDQVTYVCVIPDLTANAYGVFDLMPGTYALGVYGATQIYAAITGLG
jgi:hypothetical protein